jgi:tRNA G10  N-methylase Trm11
VTRAGLERSLSVWTRFVRHLNPSMAYRVITRVLDEHRFKRTELRRAVTEAIALHRPRWHAADPAAIEIWVLEHRRSQFVAGLRLSDKRMRQHGQGRDIERHGALRPVVAAAMVRLAAQAPGRLLDPCRGSGTIVREARDSGWDTRGSDIDPDAVSAARANLPGTVITQADAANLPCPDGSLDAVATNLPFGKQFTVDGDPKARLRDVLHEFARVTRPGGRVVVLTPPPTPKNPRGLSLVETYPLRLLSTPTRIWVYDRSDSPASHDASDPQMRWRRIRPETRSRFVDW